MHPVLKWAVFGLILCLVTVQVIEDNLPAFMAATSGQKTAQIARDDQPGPVAQADRQKISGPNAETRSTDKQAKIDRQSNRPVQKLRIEKPRVATGDVLLESAPQKPAQNIPAPAILDMTPDSGLEADALSASRPTIDEFPSGDE